MKEATSSKILGFIKIVDVETNEVVLDVENAINPENMSVALAESLGHKPGGPIDLMVFGNGAASTSGVGTITYLQPNTVGENAALYNQTYSKIVDDNNVSNIDPTRNNMVISHVTGNLFTDIIISCYLDNGEPVGQNATDNTNNINAPFVFNEIGLVNYDGLLLTHAIFSPVEKSLNRIFNITYTLRIMSV